MKKVMQYVRPQLGKICFQFTIKLGSTIAELLLPWMLSHILDNVVPTGDMRQVYLWGGLMILCSAIALIGNIIPNRMATKTSRDITEKLRHDLFEKVTYLSSKQTDRFTVPSLISRLTADTYNVHQMIDRIQRAGVRAPIMVLGGTLITLTLDPVLTLILVCMLPLLGFIIWYISSKGIPLYTEVQGTLDTLVRKIQENMTGVRIIKALSKSGFERDKFDKTNSEMFSKEKHAGMLMAVTNPVMNLILNVGLTLVIVIGAFRVNAGLTQPGKIIAFLTYFTLILNSLMMISRMFVMISKGISSAKRIEQVFDAPDDMKANACDHEYSDYHIEFKNVGFSYNKKKENITDISFALRRGETLGIIGPTGSGKSTIVNLLLRFYDPDSGEIRISGDKIDGIEPEVLHTMFGVVFQNDFLFADSIRENIDFGRSLNNEQIEKAAKTAQADFILEKENGFSNQLTTKGSNLSGGQKQRLLIARALAASPQILVFDDCSSALDYKTDAELRRSLSEDFKETTTIIIAQRISSIMGADKIMVLDEGRIIGYGSHLDLMQSCKSYQEIYEIQMGKEGDR